MLGSSGSGSVSTSGEEASEMGRRFNELRDEYKLYRKRAMEAIQVRGAFVMAACTVNLSLQKSWRQ
jgi:hypothetical protein